VSHFDSQRARSQRRLGHNFFRGANS
jgi:hypothetical protein